MNISTEQIEAFLEIIRKGSFSVAARTLGITQAALSIRIRKLEESIETSLLIRGKAGLTLTEAGREFQKFAESFENLKREFLSRDTKVLSGELKVGCFSTIGRSLVLPALQKFLSSNEGVRFSFFVKEVHELYPMLQSGEADIIFLDHLLPKEGLIQEFLGNEEYVFVTGKKKINQDIYLNHDEKDLTSFKYYESLGQKKTRLNRRYLDEIYSVLDGVASDVGVSVLPYHLAREYKNILVPHPGKKLLSPVYLCFKERAFYPRVLSEATKILRSGMSSKLRH